MAAPSGKKGRKKGKTLSINEFLGNSAHSGSDGTSFVNVPTNIKDWSEDVADEHNDEVGYGARTRVALPTAPRASRETAVDLSQLPDKPPFTAFVGNLSYDVDEDSLAEFFSKLSVTNVRLPKDGGRLRGFGYVEFATRQDLVDALGLNEEEFMNRKVRINLVGPSSHSGQEGRGGDNRRGFNRGREDDDFDRPADTDSNWRGGTTSVPERRYEGSDGPRAYNDSYRRNDDGRSSQRSDAVDGPAWTRSEAPPRGDADEGPRRDYDDGPRRGFGGGPRRGYDDEGPRRTVDDGPRRGYDDGPRRGYDDGPRRGYDDGPRRGFDDGPRRGYDDGPRRGYDDGPRRGYDDGPRRGYDDGPRRGYDDGPRRGYDDRPRHGDDDGPRRSYDDHSREEPKERPKLQLQPRSKPAEEKGQATAHSSSVFGAAKPVDTAAREREIEQKLLKEKDRPEFVPKPRGFGFRKEGDSDYGTRDREKAARDDAPSSVNGGHAKGSAGLHSAAPVRGRDESHADHGSAKPLPAGSRLEGGGSDRTAKGKWAKPLPISVDDMPKMEIAKQKDFSDGNKFAGLLTDGSDHELNE